MKNLMLIFCLIFTAQISKAQGSFNVTARECEAGCLLCGNISYLKPSGINLQSIYNNSIFSLYRMQSGVPIQLLSSTGSTTGSFEIIGDSIKICTLMDFVGTPEYYLEITNTLTNTVITSNLFGFSNPTFPSISVLRGCKSGQLSHNLSPVNQQMHKLTYCNTEHIVLDLGLNLSQFGCLEIEVTPYFSNNTLNTAFQRSHYIEYETFNPQLTPAFRFNLNEIPNLSAAFNFNQQRSRIDPNRYQIKLTFQNCNPYVVTYNVTRGVTNCEKEQSLPIRR